MPLKRCLGGLSFYEKALMDHYKFLQSKEERDIRKRLKESIERCVVLRSTVAFFNLDIKNIEGLADILKHSESFLCVDIHQPTDIGCLEEFVKEGSNIYLFLYRDGSEKKQPLLHTKLLLFDCKDDTAEVWIGSQNLTHSALSGFNLEATSIITTTKNSKFYKDIKNYINFIKKCCIDVGKRTCGDKTEGKFDTTCVDFYKKLQGSFGGSDKKVMVVCCGDVECLDGKTLLFLSRDKKDSSNFLSNAKFMDREFILCALDSISKFPIFYICNFSNEGTKPEQLDQSLKDCEGFILRDQGIRPLHFERQGVDIDLLSIKEFGFFVTMKIGEEINLSLLDKRTEPWENCKDDPNCNFKYDCLKETKNIQIPIPKKQYDDKEHKFRKTIFFPEGEDLFGEVALEKKRSVIEILKKYYNQLLNKKEEKSTEDLKQKSLMIPLTIREITEEDED